MPNKEIGVLTEQGFVAGTGLGYEKLSEADQAKLRENDDKKNDGRK